MIVAQDLVETGFLDSAVTAATSLIAAVERSFEDHAWIWIAVITVILVLLLRPKR